MATLPAAPLVPVDEYLNTSYEQDVEFVDGRLVEKGMPTFFHQLLSAILLSWFRQYEKQFSIKALADVRTQIIERARYRLPDVMVLATPAPARRVVTQVPNVVIEIVSPDDKQTESLLRFRDYGQLGVQHMIQMEPEEHVAWRFENDSLIRTDFHHLSLPGRPDLPFDSGSIFEQLRREIAEYEGSDSV
jgi:Uma2 family endonuclease